MLNNNPFESNLKNRISKNLKTQTLNFNFKPKTNEFLDMSGESLKKLEGFTILTIGDRFFYQDPTTKNTYMSNIILSPDEDVYFYKDKESYNILGKEKHSFEELEFLSKTKIRSLNRKIILIGLYDGKLTKVEASIMSERPVLQYLENSGGEDRVDLTGEKKIFKGNEVYVLFLKKSLTQKYIKDEELKDLEKRIYENIKKQNINLYTKIEENSGGEEKSIEEKDIDNYESLAKEGLNY